MIYLKKITLNFEEKQQYEIALRKAALKRHTALDFKSSVTNIGTDKLFLGYDGKDSVQFTRLRSSLEKFLPKIIITISKKDNDDDIKIRLGVLPFIILALFTIVSLATIVAFLTQKNDFARLIPLLILTGLYILLIISELKITERKIKKALTLNITNQQKSPA